MSLNRRGFMVSTVGLAAFAAIRADARPAVAPRFGPISGSTYAFKGEKTYCANGCVIGAFGQTVRCGDEPKSGDLVPVDGMSVAATDCPFCTAPVCAGPGYYFFISDSKQHLRP